MIRKLVAITKKAFFKNVIIMVTGTAAAQVINFILTPIITRIYGPEAFGVMGIFIAIVSVIGPISALTYPIAIVLPKEERDAKDLVRLSLLLTIFTSLCIFLILVISSKQLVRLFEINDISHYLYFIPVVIFFSGLFQIAEQWVIRTKEFIAIAKASLFQAIIVQGSKVLIGTIYPFATTLILIQAFSEGIRAILIIFFRKNRRINTNKTSIIDFTSLKKSALKHKDFPIYRAPQVLINGISQNIPVLLLASLFGPTSAGFYSLGRMVLNIPTQLIGKSFGDVFYPRINEAANNGEKITKIILKAIVSLSILGIIPFGIIIVLGPSLFSVIFGLEWEVAGEYARWIAIVVFFILIYQPCIKSFPILSAQRFHLFFTIISLIVSVVAFLLVDFIYSNDLIAIALYGVSNAFLNFLLIIITLVMSKRYDRKFATEERILQNRYFG
ncbi:lipopolysaccharide biosynthesis protein [Aquibacillus albus]|uniref:O-antigen/teichoic acid export membrane protein n=1 Tax=Aquibacillus albus TaxID=1168171 RepID=A0ABS2N634_9BACI|nr:oligosaccharide flippase family protein [Aquibacillus albus]MBM7573503.1 O-antigen/teichoic acid export membrane protein [Aquibacillus albus]